MACHRTKCSWLVFSIAFASVATLWLFNPGICGVGFGRSTITARVDSTLEKESLLIGTPPWVPIAIKTERIASGVLSALRCNATCLDKVACEETEVKLCFWDQNARCTCRLRPELPTEWGRPIQPAVKLKQSMQQPIAILMGGQTRSLASTFVQETWRLLLKKLSQKAKVVVFAVLSRKSSTKGVNGTTMFESADLERMLDNITRGIGEWRGVFPMDCNWDETASLVTDPALNFILSPPVHLKKQFASGQSNAYRSRVVGFDMMLRFEADHFQRFGHVFFVRPDSVLEFGANPFDDLAKCSDFVYFINDIFAAMPRNLAPYFATHLTSFRSFTGLGPGPPLKTHLEEFRQEFSHLTGFKFAYGGANLPMVHLSHYSVPWAGRDSDMLKVVLPCKDNTHLVKNIWLIRNLPMLNASGNPKICRVKDPKRAATLESYSQHMGIIDKLHESTVSCW